ncbi:hypothetical protein PHPALM_30156, partial [Phytophthora palmivora]
MAIQERQHHQRRADRYVVISKMETKPSNEVELRLAHHIVTTPVFHDFLVGVTGDPNVTVPSSKAYNEILDNHYARVTKDSPELFLEKFKELDNTHFTSVLGRPLRGR